MLHKKHKTLQLYFQAAKETYLNQCLMIEISHCIACVMK